MLTTVNSENFKSFITDNKVAVVKFGAPWCPACVNIEPILQEAQEELVGRAVIGVLDVDDNPELCDEFEVDSIPDTFVFVEGKLKKRRLGGMSKEEIIRLIEE